jgi:hypothetical protein
MERTAQDIWICKNVVARIGSDWYSVSSVSVVLQASTIPEITLSVDPMHAPGSEFAPPPTSDISTATAVTLTDLKAWHDKLQAATKDRTQRAMVAMYFDNVNPGDYSMEEQSISISDWIVVSSGITQASASGNFGLEVTIQHPAGLLDKSVSGLGNIAVDTSMGWYPETYQNPVQGLASAFRRWAKFDRTPPLSTTVRCADDLQVMCMTPEAAVKAMQKTMTDSADLLDTVLVWNTEIPNNSPNYTKFPLEGSCFAGNYEALTGMKLGLVTAATPPDGIGVWDALVSNIVDDYQLTIIPMFWKAYLYVMPFTPWANPAMTIYDDEISDVVLPGVDGAPIAGVKVMYTPTQGPLTDDQFVTKQEDVTDAAASEICFIPKQDPINGRVISAGMPTWYQSALQGESAANGTVNEQGTQEATDSSLTTTENIGANATPPTNGTLNASAVDAAGAAMRYAAAAFYSQFRSTVEAELKCCLLIQSKSSDLDFNYIVPGYVARVSTRGEEGSALFDMYVTRVQHYISAATGEAWTRINGAYARPPEGIDKVVAVPTYNPLYSVVPPKPRPPTVTPAIKDAVNNAPSFGLGSAIGSIGIVTGTA